MSIFVNDRNPDTATLPVKAGALFDWDGVIIDSSVPHERSWEMLAQEIGKPLPADHFVRGFGMKNQFIIPNILGWTSEPEEIETYSLRKEALYREIIREEGIQALPGVFDLLRMLEQHGVDCAVASSTHRENIETVLDVLGIRSFFKAIVTSEDVDNGKPHPEVFLKSAEKIGLSAFDCMVFEDAHVGIDAGLAAGARVIAVATTNPLDELGRANLACKSLIEVQWDDIVSLYR